MKAFMKRLTWQLVILALFWFSVMSPTPYVYGTWVILQTALTVLLAIVSIFIMVMCSKSEGIDRHLREINQTDFESLTITYLFIASIPDVFYIYFAHINGFPYIAVCLAISITLTIFIMFKIGDFKQKVLRAKGIRAIPVDSNDI